ncbi:MAG: hypothetical protein ACYTA3_01065 [Planctomycetota bacterium]
MRSSGTSIRPSSRSRQRLTREPLAIGKPKPALSPRNDDRLRIQQGHALLTGHGHPAGRTVAMHEPVRSDLCHGHDLDRAVAVDEQELTGRTSRRPHRRDDGQGPTDVRRDGSGEAHHL